MNEQLLLYLWSISDSIRDVIFGLASVGLAISFIGCLGSYAEQHIKLGRKFITCGIICIMFLVLGSLMPKKNDLALIFLYPYAKSGTEQVLKSDTAKKMKEVVDLYLDSKIQEFK